VINLTYYGEVIQSMFREMRRIKQKMSEADTLGVLERGTSGVLAVSGEDGYPYAVPLSYVLLNGKIVFHSAGEGHKIDSIKASDKVSFCVIDQDLLVPEELTTYFRSAIAFGRIRVLETEDEKREALEALAEKYSLPDDYEGREREVKKSLKKVCMLELTIDHLSGKEAIELVGRS
jgi:nitroimidazol reductase NimA-like FMN-containing flavoprotein (pyridoxamine 5'-phosphate oxidase superfamily)